MDGVYIPAGLFKETFLKACLPYSLWHFCLKFFQWSPLLPSLPKQCSVCAEALLAPVISSSVSWRGLLYIAKPLALPSDGRETGPFPPLASNPWLWFTDATRLRSAARLGLGLSSYRSCLLLLALRCLWHIRRGHKVSGHFSASGSGQPEQNYQYTTICLFWLNSIRCFYMAQPRNMGGAPSVTTEILQSRRRWVQKDSLIWNNKLRAKRGDSLWCPIYWRSPCHLNPRWVNYPPAVSWVIYLNWITHMLYLERRRKNKAATRQGHPHAPFCVMRTHLGGSVRQEPRTCPSLSSFSCRVPQSSAGTDPRSLNLKGDFRSFTD